MHIVHYESLKTNLKTELRKVIQFLGLEVSDKQLDCVANNRSEGYFHRPQRTQNFDIKFTDGMQKKLEGLVNKIDELCTARSKRLQQNH